MSLAGQIVYVVLRRETDGSKCAGVFLTEAGARVAAKAIVERPYPHDDDVRAEVIPFEVNRFMSTGFSSDFRIEEPPPLVTIRRVTKTVEEPAP